MNKQFYFSIWIGFGLLVFQAPLLFAQYCEYENLYGWATKGTTTTGGQGGTVVEVNTMADLKTQASKSGKLIIYVKGQLGGSVTISSNKTIIGLPGASVGGISISSVSNVIVRNLIVRQPKCNSYEECKAGSDAVSIYKSTNIWIDHLDVADGQDGNLDITTASNYVTVSWCKFSYTYEKEHAFSNLNGSADDATGDEGILNITFHHNWWADRIMQRQPRVRFGQIHVANNLYTSQKADYLVGVGMGAKVLVEGNIMKSTGKVVEYFPGGLAEDVLTRNNLGPSGANVTSGSGFIPDYVLPIEDPSAQLEAHLRACAGATLRDPRVVSSLEGEALTARQLVYPNPFKEFIQIEFEKQIKTELVNLQGQVVATFEGNGRMAVQDLPAGLYILRYHEEGIPHSLPLQKIE